MSLSSILLPVRRALARAFGGASRAGLEVSDQAVRVIFERDGAWQLEQAALPPGTVVRGSVRNAPALLAALSDLHRRAGGRDARARIGVHVSVSSAPVYLQLVPVPPVEERERADAVRLNVQVSAPVPLEDLAWGWQPLPGAGGQAAVLAAWTARQTVADLAGALAEAGFLPASLEPKVLSVARLVRTLAPDATRGNAYLLASLDESGIALAVLDAGVVRFQYVRTWDEVRGAHPEVTYAILEELVRREAAQVAGFYAERGGTRLDEVLIATPVFQDELTATLESLGFAVRTLAIGSPPFPLHGYAAYGAALRGNVFGVGDGAELSLLGEQVRDWVRKELALRVARFWLAVTPAAVAVLLATYGAAYVFVSRLSTSLSAQPAQPALLAELADREARAARFNAAVSSLATVQGTLRPKSPLLSSLIARAAQSGVSLSRVRLVPGPERSSIAGVTGGEDQLLSFKRSLESDPSLARVLLPVAEIRSGPDGISFSMTFEASFAAAGKTAP